MLDNYSDYDAVGLAELVASGDVNAREILEAAISKADEINPVINAIVTPMFEQAREVADMKPQGPLAGVPFLIKDLNMVKGVRCSMGSRLWADFIPDHDSEIVSRYRKAGLMLMGKSNTPEVGLALNVTNRWILCDFIHLHNALFRNDRRRDNFGQSRDHLFALCQTAAADRNMVSLVLITGGMSAGTRPILVRRSAFS